MKGNVKYTFYSEGYGLITLDRVSKRNAISRNMMNAFAECIQQARRDPLKILIITGAGDKMFCAGGDLSELHGNLSNDEAFQLLNKMKEVVYQIATFPVPTVCLLNGDALGGGCEIATACDIRITNESNTFGFVQANLGIVPGWGGGALLYEKVSTSFAYQWLLHAKIYEATYLLQQGWINKIVSNDETIEKLVHPYLKRSVAQMKILKKQFLQNISLDQLYERMSEEVRTCASLWDSEEHKQAVLRFKNEKK